MVDWSKCSSNLRYEKSAGCSKQVGNHIGTLIKFLAEKANLNIRDLHLIGHSLGAQAMSFVAEVLPQKIPRITGLSISNINLKHITQWKKQSVLILAFKETLPKRCFQPVVHLKFLHQ